MAYSAKQYALWLLARRSYSVFKLKEKLLTKYPQEEVEGTIDFLKNIQLLDDSDYGVRRAVFLSKKKSNRQIKFELSQKGLAPEDIEDSLLEVEDEEIRVKDLLEKEKITPLTKDKLIQKYCRKGFKYSTIKKIIAELIEKE